MSAMFLVAPCFVLVPIVIGASVYGVRAGAILGGVFGVVVVIGSMIVGDLGTFLMGINPFLTILMIMTKGILAGLAAAAAYKLLKKFNEYAGVVAAAVLSPIVNTGIFLVGVTLMFSTDVMDMFTDAGLAEGTDTLLYVLIGLIAVNFIIEFAVNIVLSPAIIHILKIVKTDG
jgi:uncharacterized membrane protein